MKNKNQKGIIVLSSEGLPFGFSAMANKNRLIAKIFYEAGLAVYVFNKQTSKGINNKRIGFKDGIKYTFPRGKCTFSSFAFNRICSYISATIQEYSYLRKLRVTNEKIFYIISYTWFPLFIYYYFITNFLGIRLLINIMEWHIFVQPKNWIHKMNNYLFDKLSFKMVDAAIPISEAIDKEIFKVCSNLPRFIIPAISDFDEIDQICNTCKIENNKYFLYCGNLGYFEVIEFTINAFYQANLHRNISLVLVLSGRKESFNRLRKSIIEKSLLDRVIIYSNLSFYDLICKYKNALALIIPLRNTLQDNARFPHKIAEYLATGVPVITNKVGDIAKYLNHDNALLCDNYVIEEFADMIEYVVKNPEKSKEVGINGRNIAKNVFNYKNYINTLPEFITSL